MPGQGWQCSKARGQWGERMAEDVLRLAGFIEHVNYEKQVSVDDGTGIPDYTFLLPKGHVLYMDVKFPLAAYLRYLEASTDAERAAHCSAFLRDVKVRVKELAARQYSGSGRRAFGEVLLFIPNETISGFIHEHEPSLIEDALGQGIVLCLIDQLRGEPLLLDGNGREARRRFQQPAPPWSTSGL